VDPCGDFLDALLGVVFVRPAYIRPDDLHRYAAWIDAFRSHVIDRPWGMRRGSRFPVAEQPLRELGYALRDWVDTVLRADNHALHPTLALAAARFIEAHAYGHSDYGRESWRLTGLMDPDLIDTCAGRDRLVEPRLKHEITSRLKGTLTRCAVPLGGRLPGREDALLLRAGEPFVFVIERCHLTQENYYDRLCVRAVESDPPRFDIAADLWFRGAVILDPTTSGPITCLIAQADLGWEWNRREWSAEIPVRWITDVYECPEGGGAPHPVPIPQWRV
jgi:hypothetical protein